MSKKFLFLFLVGLIIIILILLCYFFYKQNSKLIVLENRMDNLSIEFTDKKILQDKLKEYKVIDGQKVKRIHLVVSDTELADPTFVQNDKEGNAVIASSIDIADSGLALVEISLGDFVLSQDDADKSRWLDSGFIQVCDQLSKWNLAAKDEFDHYREMKPFFVFDVKKK